jgi:hypothetical protein
VAPFAGESFSGQPLAFCAPAVDGGLQRTGQIGQTRGQQGWLDIVGVDLPASDGVQPGRVKQPQIAAGQVGPGRDDRRQPPAAGLVLVVLIVVPLAAAAAAGAVGKVEDHVVTTGPGGGGIGGAIPLGGLQSSRRAGSRSMTCRVPQPVVYRNASSYLSARARGFPLKSPYWYVSTKLVGVIRARVDSARTPARPRASAAGRLPGTRRTGTHSP